MWEYYIYLKCNRPGRWMRLSGDIVTCISLFLYGHTGEIYLSLVVGHKRTFTQAVQSRDMNSDNMLTIKGFLSVQNNRKQTCLRQTFTSNNEMTSGTIRTSCWCCISQLWFQVRGYTKNLQLSYKLYSCIVHMLMRPKHPVWTDMTVTHCRK